MASRRFAGIVLAVAAVVPLGAAGAATEAEAEVDPATDTTAAVVRTEAGLVRGRTDGGHLDFQGIPYAAPPVGEGRWAPPRRPRSWSGVRDATTPGNVCAQPGYLPDGTPTVTGAEDCLYLNVTTPTTPTPAAAAAATRARGRRLPVMVWLHGGGFVSGAGTEYDGARLAEAGNVMVVTVNYRLGPLGFLSTPALDGEGERGRDRQQSGNYGLQDQQAALRWVERNAARFGGDPGNVTIFGQSAGSITVCAHLASPGSRGLYDKAIAQSGSCANDFVTKPVADERGRGTTTALGCDDAGAGVDSRAVAACLRERPVADVLATTPPQGPVTDERADRPWLPVVGTSVLPRQPIDALARGSAADVPLMVGSTQQEMWSFVGFRYDAGGRPLTVAAYEAVIADTFGPDAADVLARYPASAHPSPAQALATVLTDWGRQIGACPVLETARVAARQAPVFAYELTEDSGEVYEGFPLGAYHSWDLPFLWDLSIPDSAYPELTPSQRALSERMVGLWTTFAHTGDPNARGSDDWPRFDPAVDSVLSLAAGEGGIAPAPFAAPHQCTFWSTR